MLKRAVLPKLRRDLARNAAVVLLGPRQVGKTTLALELAAKEESLYIDLENPADAARLSDPQLYFEQNPDKLIILDEVQRYPDIFQLLRSRIDINRRRGRRYKQFLLLGSASDRLLNQSSESLAGRAGYRELAPLNLLEAGAGELNRLWVNGGFPIAYLVQENSLAWRRDFIRSYLERDIPALGFRIPAETLRRFWTMLAHNQGQLFNASRLGAGLGVKGQTVSRYLDLLVDLLLVRRLEPWSGNLGKRLVKSPKVYLRDSGILHALLGIETLDGLLSHPVVGASWEGFVIENLMTALPEGAYCNFYRTAAGAELDLVVTFADGTNWAIETKRTNSPKLSRGFQSAYDDLKPAKGFFVYGGDEVFPLREGVEAVPLEYLMKELVGQ